MVSFVPCIPLAAPSQGRLCQGSREPLQSCHSTKVPLPDTPWCFGPGLLLACVSLGPVLTWLKELHRLQHPSLVALSLCFRLWLMSRPAGPSPYLVPAPAKESGVTGEFFIMEAVSWFYLLVCVAEPCERGGEGRKGGKI